MWKSPAGRLSLWIPTLAFLVVFGGEASSESLNTQHQALDRLIGNPDYVNLETIQGIAINLKYASTDNFIGEALYGEFHKAFLHKVASAKLKVAAERLQQLKPGWKLVVYDALRPRSIQRLFWNRVKGTPQQPYVANPDSGSIHNFGFAVDVSLMDESGREVDMGTKYDDFSGLSEPRLEERFLKAGKLGLTQVDNRRLLRKVMTAAGFEQLLNEWWHFDALPSKEVREHYHIVE